MRLNDEYQGSRFPPGGYPFHDNRTGMNFDAMQGGIEDRVSQVIKHRIANPNLYPTSEPKFLDRAWVRLEIEDQICSNRPSICGNTTAYAPPPPINQIEFPTTPCPRCGVTNWKANLCPTCGRAKVTSYSCIGCGKTL